VKVRAYGIEYTGVFKGADEDWVFLQCQTTWVQIPWLEITSFLPAEAKEEKRIYRKLPGEPEPEKKDKKAKKRRRPEVEMKIIRGEKDLSPEEPAEPDGSLHPEKKRD